MCPISGCHCRMVMEEQQQNCSQTWVSGEALGQFPLFSVTFLVCLYFLSPCPSCRAPCPHFIRTFSLPPIFLKLGCVMPHLVAVGCFEAHWWPGGALLLWWGSVMGSLFLVEHGNFQMLPSFAASCLFLPVHLFSFPWTHGWVSAACQVCPDWCRKLCGTQAALCMGWHFQPVLPEQGWMWCSGP